jgi:hypothetical protein
MSAAFWFRKEPPLNSLISRRCSDLVNSSQGVAGILIPSRDSDRRLTRQGAATLTAYATNTSRAAAASICSD